MRVPALIAVASIVVVVLAGLALFGSGGGASSGPALPDAGPALRVCADPNNLPFSNESREGFEDQLAGLLAHELGARLEMTWWAFRSGFIENTLGAHRCDVILGVPVGLKGVATTAPYYRSSYVFVTRADRKLAITSFDDPALRTLRIGVHVVGDDAHGTPAARALARRGIIENVTGFVVTDALGRPNPPATLIDAVVKGDVDVAVAWGPLAGYFANQARNQAVAALRVVPVAPAHDGGSPLVFDIAAAVRPDDEALARRLEAALTERRGDVDAILDRYGVPRVAQTSP